MPLTHDEAFLEDIVTHPGDDAPRLIFADWLDDHDDPDRAEFIRVQIERRQLGWDDSRYKTLITRELTLLQEHEAQWRGTLPVLDGVNWEDFSRGFVEAVFINSVDIFLHHAETIFAAAPIRRLQIGHIDAHGAARLANSPGLAQLTELNLGNNPLLGPRGVHALASSPHLAHLTTLLLHYNGLGDEAIEELASSPHLGRLAELYLSGNALGDDSAHSLATNRAWPHLTDLDLRDNQVSDTGARALAGSTRLPALSTLYLVNNHIHSAGAVALAWSETLPRLARLYLNYNAIGNEGAVAFAQSSRRFALRDLDLRHADIHAAGGRALAETDTLDGLDLLWLGGNPLRMETFTLLRRRFGKRLRI